MKYTYRYPYSVWFIRHLCFLPLIMVNHAESFAGCDLIVSGQGGRLKPCSSMPPVNLETQFNTFLAIEVQHVIKVSFSKVSVFKIEMNINSQNRLFLTFWTVRGTLNNGYTSTMIKCKALCIKAETFLRTD